LSLEASAQGTRERGVVQQCDGGNSKEPARFAKIFFPKRIRRANLAQVFSSFHHRWCNLREIPKSYVNEGLQRLPNVLPSGPFKKVSQRPTEEVSSRVPMYISGANNGEQPDQAANRQ
jgi:hypothetical protein